MGFFRRGISMAKWAATPPADPAAPTRLELDAAIDLGDELTAMSGFQFTGTRINYPVLNSRRQQQIAGEDTLADSSITFIDPGPGVDAIRAALAKGEAGGVYWMDYGDVPGERIEFWPAESMGVNSVRDLGATPATYKVDFAITDIPEVDGVIPAAS